MEHVQKTQVREGEEKSHGVGRCLGGMLGMAVEKEQKRQAVVELWLGTLFLIKVSLYSN